MAHQLEVGGGRAAMFWAGETPWHGLGRELPDCLTVADGIAAGGLDWEVELVPLVTGDRHREVPARAVRRTADGRVLGVVAPGYHPLQNRDAFAWFQPFLDAGLASLHTGGSLCGGQRAGCSPGSSATRW